MSRRSRTVTLDPEQHKNPDTYVRNILHAFSDVTWTQLEFKGSKKFTLTATGSQGEEFIVQFYTEKTRYRMADTAADVGSAFGRNPSASTLFEELLKRNGQRKFDVTD